MRSFGRPPAHLVVILFAAAAAGACSPPSDTTEPAAAVPAAPAPGTPGIVGKAAPGVVVTLEPVAPREFPLPEGPAIMDQYAKQFVPDLLLVRVGQPVEFRNSEAEPHNVNVNRVPTGTAIFSVGTAPYQKHEHTFDRPGQYAVSCDIHPGMRATVVVTTTPWVAIADPTGAFRFPDLEPGRYKLAWTADGTTGEKRVDVSRPETAVTIPD